MKKENQRFSSFPSEKEDKRISEENSKSIKQEKIHDIIFSHEIGWQEIIYELINTEQIDPWDVDITLLTNRYLEKIHELEENYFISSKVLLAAALLLRIKSEILLNKYIKSIDEILFGKKEQITAKILERIDLEDEIPELVPKSPLPRLKKVTLKDLIDSLNKAIVTENRRIKREILETGALRESEIALPRRKFTLRDKIKEIYSLLVKHLADEERVYFGKISGNEKENKIIAFTSLLYLEQQNRIWIEQKEHFGEIHIWNKKDYLEKNKPFEILWQEYEKEIKSEKEKKMKKSLSKNTLQEQTSHES